MSALSLSKVYNPRPGWYRGDFHLHSTFSDGRYSPADLARLAKEEGLDFFAITDHNSIGAFREFGDDAGILVIPGIEVTLYEGHWNVFGMEGWQDWMEDIVGDEIQVSLRGRERTTTDVMRQASALGMLNSINHPLLKPWEWRDGSTLLGCIDCLEIWNDPLWPDNAFANPQAVALWTSWLEAGYRMTAIGGSDFHFYPNQVEGYPGERPGLPTTYVYAERLSGESILSGLRKRQVYVSMGPKLTFQARARGVDHVIGAELGTFEGAVELAGSVSDGESAAKLQVIKNGNPIAEIQVQGGRADLTFSDRGDSSRPHWYRLEATDVDGGVIAITNPIFAGPRQEAQRTTFGDFIGLSMR